MLGNLQLDGFRGFETYSLNELTRVNLLVGKNNCGKTSILEATEFLVSGGDPFVLTQAANRRGEVSEIRAAPPPGSRPDISPRSRPDISHYFFGHLADPGASFRLSGDGYGPISVAVRLVDDDDDPRYFGGDSGEGAPFVLEITGNAVKGARNLPLTESGALLTFRIPLRALRRRAAGPPGALDTLSVPVELVTPDSLDPDRMRVLWDRVLSDDRESEVVDAMKLLDGDLKSISFLTSDSSRMRSDRAGVLLGFQGGGRRVPLGSHGDGMRRLLALSLALTQTAGGLLLVDEIDTGLHWTVMEDMWRLVVDTARKSSVQVFATTHSLDCIRGLAALVESYPDVAGEVSTHKIERLLDKAVRFDATDVHAAVEHNIEMR